MRASSKQNLWDALRDEALQQKAEFKKYLGPRLRGGDSPPFQHDLSPREVQHVLGALMQDPNPAQPVTKAGQDAKAVIEYTFKDAERRAKVRRRG